jgi:hypothetical protein
VILSLEIGADGKVAKKIQETLRGLHSVGSFFLASLDDDAERYVLLR